MPAQGTGECWLFAASGALPYSACVVPDDAELDRARGAVNAGFAFAQRGKGHITACAAPAPCVPFGLGLAAVRAERLVA